jgi:hypothetical protein
MTMNPDTTYHDDEALFPRWPLDGRITVAAAGRWGLSLGPV